MKILLPSAEAATDTGPGKFVKIQLLPALVEMYSPRPLLVPAPATMTEPSAEEAKVRHVPEVGEPFVVQVAPESPDRYMGPAPIWGPDASLVPSADIVTGFQICVKATLAFFHVAPELVERYIGQPPPASAAANFVPSADEATQFQ